MNDGDNDGDNDADDDADDDEGDDYDDDDNDVLEKFCNQMKSAHSSVRLAMASSPGKWQNIYRFPSSTGKRNPKEGARKYWALITCSLNPWHGLDRLPR